jgi:hypothetical protein
MSAIRFIAGKTAKARTSTGIIQLLCHVKPGVSASIRDWSPDLISGPNSTYLILNRLVWTYRLLCGCPSGASKVQ